MHKKLLAIFSAALCLNSIASATPAPLPPIQITATCTATYVTPGGGSIVYGPMALTVANNGADSKWFGFGTAQFLFAMSEMGDGYYLSLSQILHLTVPEPEYTFKGALSDMIHIYPKSNSSYGFVYFDREKNKEVWSDTIPTSVSLDYQQKGGPVNVHRKILCHLVAAY